MSPLGFSAVKTWILAKLGAGNADVPTQPGTRRHPVTFKTTTPRALRFSSSSSRCVLCSWSGDVLYKLCNDCFRERAAVAHAMNASGVRRDVT